MTNLEEDYKKALFYINNGPKSSNITNKVKLDFYAIHKQITKGDNKTTKPSMFNIIELTKWNAWLALKGKSKENAQSDYVKTLDNISKDWRNYDFPKDFGNIKSKI